MAVTKETAPFTFSGNWNITDYGEGRYYAKLLSDGALVPKKDITVDVFLVGQGGSGGTGFWPKHTEWHHIDYMVGGGGGGGGETKTYLNQLLTQNEQINVVIAASGGAGTTSFNTFKASRGRSGSSASSSGAGYGGSGFNGIGKGGDGGEKGEAGTTAFHDSSPPFNGMRFAGGGGGGATASTNPGTPTALPGSGQSGRHGGGSGGGKCGTTMYQGVTVYYGSNGTSGAANSGGGSGARGAGAPSTYTVPVGGSGIVMLRGYYGSFPSIPGDIIMPGAIFTDETFSITWGVSVDADNDLAGYKLERSLDDGSTWTQIYQGAASHTTDIVPFGTATVMYRVKAYDSGGLESGYKTGATQVVINNNKPVITAPIADLGTQNGAFSFDFSVDDSDPADVLTVTVKSGTNEIMAITNAVRGQTYTASISAELFVQAHGGVNEIVITATDGKGVVTEKILWTRIVMKVDVIAGEFGGARAVMPTMILISPLIEAPVDAILTALVCNNSFDTSPTWEDASDEARAGSVYLFTNQTKTANDWGIKIRVTLERDALPGTLKLLRLAASVK
jgi:hypothetical protein